VLKKGKIHSAVDIARHFDRKSFRTIGGDRLTPRTVDILRKAGPKKMASLTRSETGTFEYVYTGGS